MLLSQRQLSNPKRQQQPGIQRLQALTDIAHSLYIVIAIKPMHRLQICLIVHNYRVPPTIPPSYIWVRAVVCICSEGQTDTQTRMTNIRFVSSMTHAKCSNPFNGPLSRSNQVSITRRNIHLITPHPRGYYTTSLINFLHFLRSTASSLHIC